MLRIRYLLTTALLLVFALWVIQCYRSSVLDPDFLLYGQSVTLGPGRGPVRNPAPFPAITRQNQDGIALERMTCEGSCPWYLLEIDSSGAVSFKEGPAQNRGEGRKSTITTDQFRDLVGRFEAIHFFELNDLYHPTGTDIPPVHIRLTVNGKTKSITHSDITPPGLEELERTIERATNIHRWLHGDAARFSLQSSVAGGFAGEDLTNNTNVRHDVETRIKPGMTQLMQIAGGWGMATKIQAQTAMRRMQHVTDADRVRWTLAELRQALERGDDVNAADETGWTALMVTAAMAQPQSVSTLLDAGAHVDQRDRHSDTALIGAASVPYPHLKVAAAETVGILLAHGASVDATNDLGESPLMWAASAGNAEAIKLLLSAAANPALVDRTGHDALFYLRNARDHWAFDPATVARYDEAESVLLRR
ncbi:MAG: hypothetical protein DMG15_16315 [Acidobacteria bacterium]|nr:MAG: hypothetical protein DMG15_16315 [Acidobacteriota bacterium]